MIWIELSTFFGGVALGAVGMIYTARVTTRLRLRRESFLRAALDINTMVIDARRRLVDLARSHGRSQ